LYLLNRYIRYQNQRYTRTKTKTCACTFIHSITRQCHRKDSRKNRQVHKSHKPGTKFKKYLPPRLQIDHSNSKLKVNTSCSSSLTKYTSQPQSTSSPVPLTQRHKRQCLARVQGNFPVHLLRGIDCVGLSSRVGVFLWGGP
jgi:hypothetical protein